MMPEQKHDPDDLPPGTALCEGRFVVETCLGRGGVATVYRVRADDGRRLALKLMVTRRAADGDQRERFENEWRILKALRGLPYVVSIDGSGRHDDGRPCFTMELVEGPTLADLIAERDVTVARACWIAREVAHALDDLHVRGVVHRDIKPDNIMVTPDGVRLLDFGYAYTRGSEQLPQTAGLTSTEHRPGTPLYMAPEQVDGALPTPAFDIYALGVTLHEALVGHAPYSDLPQREMLLHKTRGLEGEPSIEGRMVGLRKGLVQLIDQALVRRPAERVKSAAEFRDRLDAVLEEMGDEDFPAGSPERPVAAAGVLEEVDGEQTLAVLRVVAPAKNEHERPANVSTERVLRPAIAGGRGETVPVPMAVVPLPPPDSERTLDGLEVPEDLKVEAPDVDVDERAELLALREAVRRAAEEAKAKGEAEVKTEAVPQPVSPAERPGEITSLRRAAQHAEAEAQAAMERFEARGFTDAERAAIANDEPVLIPPEFREASIKKAAADQAKQALEQAEAAAKAEQERREADAKAKAAAQAAANAEASAAVRRKWFGMAAVVVLLLGVGAWWGLGGDDEHDARSPDAGATIAAPHAVEAPHKKDTEPTPEPAPKPAPAVAPEPAVAPGPAVAPEPAPAPQPVKPSRKVKPSRQPEPAPETEKPCTDVAAEAKAASRDKQWSRVLKLTKSSRCWTDDGVRVWLRVQALSELGRFAECAALESSSRNPEAKRLAKSCATQLQEETTP